jgi:hypothetical protein
MKAQGNWRSELGVAKTAEQRTALIMTIVFPTYVPTPTTNSDSVSTCGEMVEEYTAACSEPREPVLVLRFAGRSHRQASPTPCPKGALTRLPRTMQPSARDSRHRVTVPRYSASSSRDPQSATNANWESPVESPYAISAVSLCAPVA